MRQLLQVAIWLAVLSAKLAVAQEFRDVEAYWVLLHEPAAVEELKLSRTQEPRFRELLDGYDLRFFPLRNKSQVESQAGVIKLLGEVTAAMDQLLTGTQRERLQQLVLRRIGFASILRDDVAERLNLTGNQRSRLETLVTDMQTSLTEMQQSRQGGEPAAQIDRKHKDLQKSVQTKFQQILDPEQQAAYVKLLGPAIDASEYGRPRYKAPELITTDGWINSTGLRLADLRDKVVVVHFYACGCSNCIHNYPAYRDWFTRFQRDDFVMVGIHTPETSAERDLTHVRLKATQEQLAFPILLDAQSANWNAWGNAMWPSVYLIDKEGYLQNFWAGELNWQGAQGEKFMRERIESLLQATPR